MILDVPGTGSRAGRSHARSVQGHPSGGDEHLDASDDTTGEGEEAAD
jgi:hypothetical protein